MKLLFSTKFGAFTDNNKMVYPPNKKQTQKQTQIQRQNSVINNINNVNNVNHILSQQDLKLSMMERIKPTGKTCNSCG